MGALQAWHETKRLLDSGSEEKSRDYLEAVLEGLRPVALREYLETKSPYFDQERFDWSDPEDHATPEEISAFLAGLDELRAPNTETAKQLFFNPAIGQVSRLREMNWTGDNTYGEAIDDVIQVLLAVWEGKPFPKLDRFRCPSIFENSGSGPYRCTLQLPHGDNHKAETAYGVKTWTDEQSVNPPKNYDAEPVDRPPRCPHLFIVLAGEKPNVRSQCKLDIGHGEHHEDESGRSWTNPYSEPTANFLASGTASEAEPIKPTDAQLDKLAAEVFGDEKPGIRCFSLFEGHRCRYVVNHPGTQHRDGDVLWYTEQQTAGNPDPINRPLDTPPRCRATNAVGMQCIKPEHSQLVVHVAENGRAW